MIVTEKDGCIMKSILCFGDSNTYGVDPVSARRWPRDVRWTGLLQSLLGPDFYVIEEGYSGRTTALSDRKDPNRAGTDAITPIMKTHSPLDMVIIMLGTNDLQTHFATTAKGSAKFCECIISKIRAYCLEKGDPIPEILVVSPPLIGEDVEESRFWSYDAAAHSKSLEFAKWYSIMAKANKVHFLDAAKVASPGPDQLHMDRESHRALAQALSEKVRTVFPAL